MAKKKVEILVDDKYSPELIQSLKDNPHVKVVYLNEAGAWHVNPAQGFEPVSVEDIFASAGKTAEAEAAPAKKAIEDSKESEA